jgi:hypothetical protein
MTLLYFVAALLLVYCIAVARQRLKIYFARKNGQYPMPGHVKTVDIQRLVAEGQTSLAMRAYRELHRCGLKQAKKAIAQMKKEPA